VVVGIVGRLTPRKGHRALLEALRPLATDPGLPRWVLVVAGEGEDEGTLRTLGADLEAAGRLRWLGQVAEAPRIMRAFDLLTLPSTMETMPLTLLEGMAAGLPVVASAIYGIPELVADRRTGFLVPPGDVPALRARLRDLLGGAGLRQEMGRAGRARYEAEFTARQMAAATARILRGDGPAPAHAAARPDRTAVAAGA
jgi:glycosyltransferase involved in cell wall biosynthesis